MSNQHQPPIRYIDRTRSYYKALGFDVAYRWASYGSVPFSPLTKPLSDSTLAIVTTAAPFRPDAGPQGPGAPYNAAAKFYKVYEAPIDPTPDLRIAHVGIDRTHTSMEDPASWLPLNALARAKTSGRIGALHSKVFGLPTNRSHRVTLETDCPELVARVTASKIDAVLLIPNCPVCHQSCALAARAIEQAGIPTLIMGCAHDILEHVGVPRYVFSDFPLGNAAGKPHDRTSQDHVTCLALDLLEQAKEPRASLMNQERWDETDDWKYDYSNAERMTPEQREAASAKFRADKKIANARRRKDSAA